MAHRQPIKGGLILLFLVLEAVTMLAERARCLPIECL